MKNRIISNSNKFNEVIQNSEIKEKSEEEIIYLHFFICKFTFLY